MELSIEKALSQAKELVDNSATPCTKCLQAAQKALNSCSNAATTPQQKAACVSAWQSAITSCNAGPCKNT